MSRFGRSGLHVLALTMLLLMAGCEESPERHFQKAQEMASKAEYEAAFIELKNVLQKQPNNPEARLLAGTVLLRGGSLLAAETELLKARDLGLPDAQIVPVLSETYVRSGKPGKALELEVPQEGLTTSTRAALHAVRAEAHLFLARQREAEQSLAAAQQADAAHPAVLLVQARMALAKGQRDDAMKFIDDALQKDARFADALYLKARLFTSAGKVDEAITVYRQVVANDAAQAAANLALAELLLEKGDIAGAEQAVLAADKVVGKAPQVLYARGMVDLRRGKPELARAAFLEVLKVAPEHLPTLLAYAIASLALADYEQSISNARKVFLATRGSSIAAARVLAAAQLKSGNARAALATLESMLEKNPNDSRLLALMGEAHLRLGDSRAAMGFLERATVLEPENAAIRTRLAAGNLASGAPERAIAELERAVDLQHPSSEADLALVTTRLQSKQYDQALAAIAGLEQKLPNSPITQQLRALALLGKQDRAGARQAFERALSIQPDFFPATLKLASLDLADQQPEQARRRFTAILARDKENLLAMMALADLAATEKRDAEHLDWLQKAAGAHPSALAPRAALVRYYLNRHENKQALTIAREATQTNPDNMEAMNLLGTTQLTTGEHLAAIDTFAAMTRLQPQSAAAHLSLAVAQIAGHQLSAARKSLGQAVAIKPDFLPAQDALLRLELEQKRPEAALAIARKMQSVHPPSPLGFDREGDIHLAQRRFLAAIAAYERAVERGGGTPGLIKLHRALIAGGDATTAERRLNEWLQQHPADVQARIYAAEVYAQTRRIREAIGQYETLLRTSPDNVVALNNLAALYHREQDARARETAELAFKQGPHNPLVQDTLGWILVEQAQLPRGLDLLARAAKAAPGNPTVRYHNAAALARAGKPAEARRELSAALAGKTAFPEREAAQALQKELLAK